MRLSYESNLILYVSNQDKSTAFYSQLLGIEPSINVPGMTEITLNKDTELGIVPI